jgi:hypothetical protein
MAIGKKTSPAKFIMLAAAAAVGISKMVAARKAKKRALAEQKKAQAEMDRRTKEFEAQDTSNIYKDVRNPYENLSMENVYEDLTVNQQQARFQAQQFQQSQANIMQNLQGAAGGSGIAALAQSLANQGQIAAQQSAASIGQQEAANQQLMAQGAADIQAREQLKAQGAYSAQMQRLRGVEGQRAAESAKLEGLMGLSAGRLSASNQQVEAARQQQAQATSQLIGVGASALTGGLGGAMGGAGTKIGARLGQTKLGGFVGNIATRMGYSPQGPGFMQGALTGQLNRVQGQIQQPTGTQLLDVPGYMTYNPQG